MKTLTVLAMVAAFVLAGCCKPNQPPSFLCKLQERVVDCSKELAVSGGGPLAQKVISAIRGGGDWEAALQQLVDTAGDEAICIIGGLSTILASKPTGEPQELAARGEALKKAHNFLTRRGLSVKGSK